MSRKCRTARDFVCGYLGQHGHPVLVVKHERRSYQK